MKDDSWKRRHMNAVTSPAPEDAGGMYHTATRRYHSMVTSVIPPVFPPVNRSAALKDADAAFRKIMGEGKYIYGIEETRNALSWFRGVFWRGDVGFHQKKQLTRGERYEEATPKERMQDLDLRS